VWAPLETRTSERATSSHGLVLFVLSSRRRPLAVRELVGYGAAAATYGAGEGRDRGGGGGSGPWRRRTGSSSAVAARGRRRPAGVGGGSSGAGARASWASDWASVLGLASAWATGGVRGDKGIFF